MTEHAGNKTPVTNYAGTFTSNELCAAAATTPDRLAFLDDPCYAASVHPDGVGSIAPGENGTVGTEVITVETGGGNDKLDHTICRKTSLDRGRTLHRGFFIFRCRDFR